FHSRSARINPDAGATRGTLDFSDQGPAPRTRILPSESQRAQGQERPDAISQTRRQPVTRQSVRPPSSSRRAAEQPAQQCSHALRLDVAILQALISYLGK